MILSCMNACINQAPNIVIAYYVFHYYCQLMRAPYFLEGFQIDFICGKNGQVALANESLGFMCLK